MTCSRLRNEPRTSGTGINHSTPASVHSTSVGVTFIFTVNVFLAAKADVQVKFSDKDLQVVVGKSSSVTLTSR